MNYQVIGTRIRSYRKAKNLTQEALAERADLCTPYISHLERGSKKPSLATLVRLAESLQVTVDQLLTGNQTVDKAAFYPDMQALLDGCSLSEQQILVDVVSVLKKSLRERGMSQPP